MVSALVGEIGGDMPLWEFSRKSVDGRDVVNADVGVDTFSSNEIGRKGLGRKL